MNVTTQHVPELMTPEHEIIRERQSQQFRAANSQSVAELVASGNAKMHDPVVYVSQAGAMLTEARNRLIKAQAEFQARREHEVVKMQDRLMQMDQEHEAIVLALTRLIAKLEALRS